MVVSPSSTPPAPTTTVSVLPACNPPFSPWLTSSTPAEPAPVTMTWPSTATSTFPPAPLLPPSLSAKMPAAFLPVVVTEPFSITVTRPPEPWASRRSGERGRGPELVGESGLRRRRCRRRRRPIERRSQSHRPLSWRRRRFRPARTAPPLPRPGVCRRPALRIYRRVCSVIRLPAQGRSADSAAAADRLHDHAERAGAAGVYALVVGHGDVAAIAGGAAENESPARAPGQGDAAAAADRLREEADCACAAGDDGCVVGDADVTAAEPTVAGHATEARHAPPAMPPPPPTDCAMIAVGLGAQSS